METGQPTQGNRTLTDSEYEQLMSLVNSVKASDTPHFLEGKTNTIVGTWILDSGASEHMTGGLIFLSINGKYMVLAQSQHQIGEQPMPLRWVV